MLYTSHLLDVVERVCDRVAVLAQSKLVTVGALDDLRTKSGSDGTLEEVFRALTESEDPEAKAKALLG